MAANFNDVLDINIYFYVDPATGKVADIFSFSPFGMFVRKDGDWEAADRDNSNIVEYTNTYKQYVLDWDKDPLLSDDIDLENPESWEPNLVQDWDEGIELDEEDLAKYAYEVNTESPEELDGSEE
jgi:hypothetical protein